MRADVRVLDSDNNNNPIMTMVWSMLLPLFIIYNTQSTAVAMTTNITQPFALEAE